MAAILVYATSGELVTWTGSAAPSNATALLRTASILVRRATMTAVYATDETGVPTDTDVIDAFRDATCAQAAAMAENDVDPSAGPAGAGGTVQSTAIGSASVTYATASNTADLRQRLLTSLTSEAEMILAEAGALQMSATIERTGP